jgi:hypothetical protein
VLDLGPAPGGGERHYEQGDELATTIILAEVAR